MLKRIFYLILASMLLLCAATACTSPQTPDTDPPPQPPEEITPMLDIVKDGASSFRIIRSDLASPSGEAVLSAVELRKAILAATGCDLRMVTDWEDKDDNDTIYEIVVGQSNRAISATVPADAPKDTLQYKLSAKLDALYGLARKEKLASDAFFKKNAYIEK